MYILQKNSLNRFCYFKEAILVKLSSVSDPKVQISLISWKNDMVTVAVLGSVLAAILMVAVLVFLWLSKNRHRHVERLQRRNSIRQSLHSVRSIGSSHGGFATINAYKHKHTNQVKSNSFCKYMSYAE